MKRKSVRRIVLISLPLALGALIGGVKWKQLHPTPTPFDLQERAHLREAKIVEGRKSFSIPVDEFKATLDDFYLIKKERGDGSFGASVGPIFIPRGYVIRLRKSRQEPHYLAQIYLYLPAYYAGNYPYQSPHKPLDNSIIAQHTAKIHPVTERLLREFVAKYASLH